MARRSLGVSLRGCATTNVPAATPVVMTMNKPVGEWGEVVSKAAWVVTRVEHVVHRFEVVFVEGPSYRVGEAREIEKREQKQRRAAEPSSPWRR